MRTARDLPPVLGATLTPDGVEFAVYAGHAEAVEVCVFEADDMSGASETRISLPECAYGTWLGSVPGLRAGTRYGVRAHGPWQPSEGLLYNPDKLLLDPYARAIEGQVSTRSEVFGHVVDTHLQGDPGIRDRRDSAPFVPRAVVVDDHFDWGQDMAPKVPWAQTLLYEAHVRNQTKENMAIPELLRGTYSGMAHPANIEHLKSLGVTSVELMPVQAFSNEPALVSRGLVNHWGYNTLGFFAPHGPYAASSGPQNQLEEFKAMVKLLHGAGLEVILDVVYNHTCEQGRNGTTVSWRGLDNRAYYRLDERGHDIDVTGCGNTLDLRHPVVVRMVMDSLRYWVEQCHVDGFRFDLAVALARGRDDAYHPDTSFLVALRTDPVLSQVKLIAEPWDLGLHGWRTGQFPPPFAEWNDRFRDAVRTFWLDDVASALNQQPGHGVSELATRLSGSQDLFGQHERGPIASVNYVAAHDGFTVADMTAYGHKHNGGNGEGNRDGSDDNRSWNHGHEGPTSDPLILEVRRRSIRNLLATELLATGVPMIGAGDEMGRSQGGNNNAFCQDNELSWLDWDLAPWQMDLLATTQFLSELRRSSPVLGQRSFLSPHPTSQGGSDDLLWFSPDGHPMLDGRWNDPDNRTLTMFLGGSRVGGASLLIIFHAGSQDAEVRLTGGGQGATYQLIWDSAWERPPGFVQDQDTLQARGDEPVTVTVSATSVRIYSLLASGPPPRTEG
jgi:isoamylase